jgi:uncharacterized protein (TIGR02466 family)
MFDQSVNSYPIIFATPLFCQKFSLSDKDIESFCFSRKKIDGGKVISNVGGWQSNDFNLNKPPKELKQLSKCIFDFSLEICDFLNIKPVSTGQAWLNINEHGNFNWRHTHPNSVLSGVYYVKTPTDCGNIEFENPSMDMMVNMKVNEHNLFTSSCIKVPSERGTMYIFPSWLPHKVHPNLSKEERISISFNLK